MGHNHAIRPVTRDCICPTRPPSSHSPQCEQAFRSKFFALWQQERDRFYGKGLMTRGAEAQLAQGPTPPSRSGVIRAT